MRSNLEQYKKDLSLLIESGNQLYLSFSHQNNPKAYKDQIWYSESLVLIKLLLPDRLQDFIKLYEKPKNRKSIEYGNYVIEDALQNLVVTTGSGDRKVGPEAADSQIEQQINILKSVGRRFESSLFDIKQLVQADLFDSELEAAQELNKKGFMRGAGAVAGVVLESHLFQVCENHSLKISKTDPSISDLNDLLKSNNVIEISVWRFVQHLGDLRNKCDHKKTTEPTKDDIVELIEGVQKALKTIF